MLSAIRCLSLRFTVALVSVLVLILGALGASTAYAENPALKDFTGKEKPAVLTQAPSGGGATTQTASTRYYISGPAWASSRNEPQSYVLGLAASGDTFDVTNFSSTNYRGGFSYRAKCGFILNTNLFNSGAPGANVPCPSSGITPPSQFIGTANCFDCGTYTTVTWPAAQTSATACRNLIPPPQEVTSTNPATCRDPVTIYKGDQIGWRYTTKDYQWLAIKDTSRFNDNNGPWMFIPASGPLAIGCHVTGCWTP